MNICKCSKYNNNSGFTLIELSIVLVIIGLIIGGVLIGQELIRGAEVRSMIAQMDKLNSAVNAFRNKYNGIPGDFVAADDYLSTAANNGDGNGIIHSAAGVPAAAALTFGGAATNELGQFFHHLSLAGLIEGSYSKQDAAGAVILNTHMPYLKNNKGGIIAYGFTDYNNYWHLGAQTTANTTIATSSALSPEAAYQIDSKMDDGASDTGLVQARGGTVLEDAVTGAGTVGDAATCVVAGGPIYNTANGQALLCQLRIRTS
jgi:prepilin-type N-terminal cleavage/methylation domain-containing protein